MSNSLSIFHWIIEFLSSSFWLCFQVLNKCFILHTATFISVPPLCFRLSRFAFGLTKGFCDNVYQLSFQTTPIFITLSDFVNLFSKHFFHLRLFQAPHLQFLYLQIFNPISINVVYKNIINHCFISCQSECYNSIFPFLETNHLLVHPCTTCPVHQPDPSTIY